MIQIVEHIAQLKAAISSLKGKGKSVGLIPTMGALHEGHTSLIRQSQRETGVSVVSIFVNPTQFNDTTDLEKYPRDLNGDLKILKNILQSEDLVFTPDVKEIYPEKDTRVFDFGQLDKTMEGKFRKGHFNGVAQVVSRLFNIVTPDKAYFGEKDLQQLAIIKRLVQQENLPIKIISCPIIREEDGLAMSSRNQRLSNRQRAEAAIIPKTLFQAKDQTQYMEVDELKKWIIKTIHESEILEVEYFEIVDGEDLVPINNWSDSRMVVGCIAVQVGNIRLIDNIKLRDI